MIIMENLSGARIASIGLNVIIGLKMEMIGSVLTEKGDRTMADREKVVKGLYDLRRYLEDKEWSDNRTDRQATNVYWQTVTDAIAMLKEQDPVAPVLVGRMWECGKCYAPVGIFMDDQRDQFCRTCGRRVKWDA